MLRSGSLAPRVAVVKASDATRADDAGAERGPDLGGSTGRRITDRCVDAFRVVVSDVVSKQSSQVVFAQYDDVIEQLSPNRTHEALGRPVLPRTPECCSSGTDSKSQNRAGDVGREDRIVVEDQEPMHGGAQLSAGPLDPM